MLCALGLVLHYLNVPFPICKIREVNDLTFMILPNLTFCKANQVNNQDAKAINECPLKQQCIKVT